MSYTTSDQTMMNNNEASPMAVQQMGLNDKVFVWNACKATFRPATIDLLSDYVDPAEECHMELKPDNEKSKQLKQHKRQNSDMTDVTEEITDFSFLEECFDIPLTMMGGCGEDVNMNFVF